MKLEKAETGTTLYKKEAAQPSPWWTVVGILFQLGLIGLLALAVRLASKAGQGG